MIGFPTDPPAAAPAQLQALQLMQPKYLKMCDLGRSVMKNILDDRGADQKLEGALGEWNKPAGTAEEEATFVLFTAIVNSTAQTQEIGDEGAKALRGAVRFRLGFKLQL